MSKTLFIGFLVSFVAGGLAIGCSDSGGGSGGTGCTVGGQTYALGASFKIDCNSCTCTAEGAACTAMACLDSGPDSNSDAGTDATGDATAVDAADFSSFNYSWLGTGVSESFMLDRDCGVATTSTSSGTPPKSGTGTVAASDCEAFEKLVTSPAVVSALSDTAPKCTDITDDKGTYTLSLKSGTTIGRTASGCSSTEPFATLKSEMHRLGATYSHADGGVDADAAGD